jgi:hypothetical protein
LQVVREGRPRQDEGEDQSPDREAGGPATAAHCQSVAVKAWKQRNPQAVHARSVLARAVRKGKVERESICQVAECDKATSDAHHHDYSAPLEVVWLCAQYHRRLHHGAHLTLKANEPKAGASPENTKGLPSFQTAVRAGARARVTGY